MKLKLFLMIIGGILMCALSAVATYFGLSSAGVLKGSEITLTYNLVDYEKVYDGNETVADYTTNPYTLVEGTLLDGDVEYVYYEGKLTDVGTTTVTATVQIYDKNGYNVSSQYSIKVNPATLKITKRPIELDVNSTKISYTGSDVTAENGFVYVYSGTLAAGDTLSTSVSFNEDKSGVNVSTKIFNVYGSDKTTNYEISYANGTEVSLGKIPLVIAPVSTSKIYDGTELKFTEYKIVSGTLLTGHKLSIDYGDGIINVDESNNNFKIKSAVILDADGKDVTDYYNLDISTAGSLTIYKASITVKMNTIEKNYDGQGFTEDEISKENLYSYTLPEELLNKGFSVDMTDYDTFKQSAITNYSVGSNTTTGRFTLKLDGNTVSSSNFTITATDGLLVINPCIVHITYKDLGEIEYTGEGLTISSVYDIISNYYLDSDSSTYAYDEFDKLKLEFADSEGAMEAFSTMIDIGKHWYNTKLRLVDEDGNVNNNFSLLYDNRGTVQRTKIALTVYGLNVKATYNADSQSIGTKSGEEAYDSLSGSLLKSNLIQINYTLEEKDVGVYNIYSENAAITIMSGGQDVSSVYYDVTYVPGTFEITPATLTVTMSGSKTISYGDSFDIDNATDISVDMNLLTNDKSKVKSYQLKTECDYEQFDDAGTYDIIFSNLVILLPRNSTVLDNYNIVYEKGKLIVSKKLLTLTWGDTDFTYTGSAQIPSLTVTGIEDGDACNVRVTGSAINASETPYTASAVACDNRNYTIFNETGDDQTICEFTISKANVTIQANDKTIAYGEAPSNNSVTIIGLVGDDKIQYEEDGTCDAIVGLENLRPQYTYSKFGEPGTYIILYVDPENKITSNNYEISYEQGTLTVEKATLYVTVENATVTYGSSLDAAYIESIYANNQLSVTGFVSDDPEAEAASLNFDNIKVESNYTNGIYDTITGSYTIKVTDIALDDDLDKNYQFDYVGGKLTCVAYETAVSLDSSLSMDFTYSGKDLTIYSNQFKVTQPLVKGHTFKTVTIENAFTADTVDVTITPVIIDSLGNDVTSNYELTNNCVINTSSVNRIELQFEYVFLQYTYYDGIDDTFSSQQFRQSLPTLKTTLADGDTIYDLNCAIGDAEDKGTYYERNVILTDYLIQNQRGEDITDVYYDLESQIIGKIIILKTE